MKSMLKRNSFPGHCTGQLNVVQVRKPFLEEVTSNLILRGNMPVRLFGGWPCQVSKRGGTSLWKPGSYFQDLPSPHIGNIYICLRTEVSMWVWGHGLWNKCFENIPFVYSSIISFHGDFVQCIGGYNQHARFPVQSSLDVLSIRYRIFPRMSLKHSYLLAFSLLLQDQICSTHLWLLYPTCTPKSN